MNDIPEHGMPEGEPQPHARGFEVLEHQVEPLISLTLSGAEFVPMSQDEELMDDGIKSGSMRMKTTYDPEEGCPVWIVEYLGLHEGVNSELQSGHVLIARWDNGKQRWFDVEHKLPVPTEEDAMHANKQNLPTTREILRAMGLFLDEAI